MLKKRFSIENKMVFLFMVLLLTSCAPTIDDIKVDPIEGYATRSKISLRINLLLSEEFRNYNPTMFLSGQGDINVKLAEPLVVNTKKLVSDIFEAVTISDGLQQESQQDIQIILEPKVVLTSWNRPRYAPEDMETAIFLEWSFHDKDGKLIWVDTVKGFGVSALTRTKEQVNMALEDLFKESYERIYNAYEIQRFASSQ